MPGQRTNSQAQTAGSSSMTQTRRAGDKPVEIDDRRIGILNDHEVRISVLETAHNNTVAVREAHSKAIDELNKSLHETAISLREGLANFAAKFDSLISQIKVGFYIISIGCTVFVFVAGAFFAYNKELDERYLNRSEAMQEQVDEKESDIENLNTELKKIKKLKVIRGSK